MARVRKKRKYELAFSTFVLNPKVELVAEVLNKEAIDKDRCLAYKYLIL